MTEAVTGLLSICTKHKKPIRTWISPFVPQSWAQACQTQPWNVTCWLSQEAGATMTRNIAYHNEKFQLSTSSRKETLLLRGFLFGITARETERGKKASRVFLARSELRLSRYLVLGRDVLVTYHNSSACFLYPWFWKTLKHMHNIWNMCLITIHCLHLKVGCVRLIVTQNNPLYFWYDHVIKSNYKVGRV